MASKRPIVLAAGGTGGHIFPAFSVAATFKKIAPDRPIVMMTDQRTIGFESALGGDVSVIRHRISHGKGRFGYFLKLISLGIACLSAIMSVWRLKPAVVVGFGGYPSLPGVIAACILRVPVFLHEQNAVLGRTNRWVAGFAQGIALSFPEVRALPEGVDTRVTGNPVRPEVLEAAAKNAEKNEDQSKRLRILVVGGSQGTAIFSTLIPPTILALERLFPDITIDVLQQCREPLLEKTTQLYGADGPRRGQTDLKPFITNMAEALAQADLVIARAGASTLAELTAMELPAVLIPYPHALDNHQMWNATALEKVGGCVVMFEKETSPEHLTAVLQKILQTPGTLQSMAAGAKTLARPDAAEALCHWVLETVDMSCKEG